MGKEDDNAQGEAAGEEEEAAAGKRALEEGEAEGVRDERGALVAVVAVVSGSGALGLSVVGLPLVCRPHSVNSASTTREIHRLS